MAVHNDALGQRRPVLVAHVLAGDLEDLFARDLGHLDQFPHCLDQAAISLRLFVDDAVFHHELHLLQQLDVAQRIAADGDDVGGKARFDRT
jgi:hypothetical protein